MYLFSGVLSGDFIVWFDLRRSQYASKVVATSSTTYEWFKRYVQGYSVLTIVKGNFIREMGVSSIPRMSSVR